MYDIPAYVGRFEIRNEIASGAFAIVLRAWDEELESFVALKILRPEHAGDEEIQVRFIEEARLLRRIRSPNVVAVHDVGRLNDGRPYLVMDFADRGTLAARLNLGSAGGHPPDLQSIVALADALADGLSAIHEAGVVHRDVKPANTLFQLSRRLPADPEMTALIDDSTHAALVEMEERILVGDLGIAKDLVKRAGTISIMAGTPSYQAPEQGDSTAEITPAADVYAATAMLWHVLTGNRPSGPIGEISDLSEVPQSWRDVIRQGMAFDPGARFTSMEGWRTAIHETVAQEAAKTQGGSAQAIQPEVSCPYKGLAAFQPEDAEFFFGREALIDEVVRRVHIHQVLVVGGPSGSGKSSLVRAGLIPALKAGALAGSDDWRVALFTPGRDPMAELHFQLTRNALSGGTSVSLEEFHAHPVLARHLGAVSGARSALVLCIDQFEELFTLAPEAERSKFIEALSAMTDPADSKVRVVIAIRADFYAACAHIPWLAGRITDNQVLVGPMSDSELRRAVSEPARKVGLYLEPGLVDTLIDEAGNEAGSLPLVAHALVETWIRRKGNTLTLEGLRVAGGVAGAISQTADATFEYRFDPIEQEATKRLFLRLVAPQEGTFDTRRVMARAEIDHDTRADVLNRIVECLTDVRLLTVDDTSVQIAHEALLHTWPRLHAWIEESRDDLRMRQRISQAAHEWDAEERDSDLLYRGTPLLTALEWVAENPDQVDELEQAFLNVSDESRAKDEAVAAERARRQRRVRRGVIATLSLLASGATLASVVALLAYRDAQRNEERAILATTEAHERFAGALGAAAYGLVDTDPLLALFLGTEAVARTEKSPPGYDARAAMVAARRDLSRGGPVLLGSPVSADDVLATALSSDGSLLATGLRNGSIDIIDTATRRKIGSSDLGHRGGVKFLEFSGDDKWLASGGTDGVIQVWPIGDAFIGPGTKIGETGDVVTGVTFGPHGSTLASSSGDGTVRLWDVSKAAQIGEPLINRVYGFQSVAFSPDGRGVVAGHKDGTIYGWALPSGGPLFEPIRPASQVLHLVFSPLGDRFAATSTDGTSFVIEYPSGRIIGPAFGDFGRIGVALFNLDGRVLIGGTMDGTVKLWDVDRRKLILETPRGHSQAIVDSKLSKDGRLLATLGRDKLIRLWRFASAVPLASVRQVAGRSAKGVAISVNGRQLAAGDDTGVVRIWEPGTDKAPIELRGHKHQVWALAFSPRQTLVASGDRAGHVRLWNSANGNLQWANAAHDGAVWSLGFTPDGKTLMTASDKRVRFWNVESHAFESELPQKDGRITRGVLSADGALLAVVSTDGKVVLWNLQNRTIVREIVADDNVVWGAAFSPDSQHLATASSDEVVALWDLKTGEQSAAFPGHTGGATDVAFLADGATVVAVDRSGGLHWWDAVSGRRIVEPWRGHAGPSWRIAVHPDGERFATTGDDGRVKLWDERSTARACEIATPAFDEVRRRQYLGKGEHLVACGRAKTAAH